MNKKKMLTILTVIMMVFLLTGCTIATNPDGSIKLIYLTTPFSEMMQEGVFEAILVYPLAQAINFLSKYIGVGGAIMLMTLIINAIVLVFTFRSNVDMQRMQELQPELNKIQKKYEGRDDQVSRQRMSMEMTKLYDKYDVKPGMAMLSTFIQFPILIAMYNAVRRSAAVATGVFFGVDLALTPTESVKSGSWGAIVIYVLMLLAQLASILVPKLLAQAKAKKEAELHHRRYEKPQEANPMMTYGMIIFIGVLMLSWPTALSLYYLIFSIVNIIKTLAINKLMQKM